MKYIVYNLNLFKIKIKMSTKNNPTYFEKVIIKVYKRFKSRVPQAQVF